MCDNIFAILFNLQKNQLQPIIFNPNHKKRFLFIHRVLKICIGEDILAKKKKNVVNTARIHPVKSYTAD